MQKIGLLSEMHAPVKYHFLGFNPGSDSHEQMAKLKSLMSGRVLQAWSFEDGIIGDLFFKL